MKIKQIPAISRLKAAFLIWAWVSTQPLGCGEFSDDPMLKNCQPDSCPAHADCIDETGQLDCVCHVGYEKIENECVDFNACHAERNPCYDPASCEDLKAPSLSAECANCPDGFRGDRGRDCQDINECNDPISNNCDRTISTCKNLEGTFTCVCKDGFVDNGSGCEDIKNCDNVLLNECGENTTCRETPGSYECDCIGDRFRDLGLSCVDLDECSDTSLNDCSTDTLCENIGDGGGFTCTWVVADKTACDAGGNGSKNLFKHEGICYRQNTNPSQTALYLNPCEDSSDFETPYRGAEYKPNTINELEGDYSSSQFIAGRFDSGLQVDCKSRTVGDHSTATITPFTQNKPDLAEGTVTFWGFAEGSIAGERKQYPLAGTVDNRILVSGDLWFYLTEHVYVNINGPATRPEKDMQVSLVVEGTIVETAVIPLEDGLVYTTLQWNMKDGFRDGTNLRLYLNDRDPIIATSTISREEIASFSQFFKLESKTYYNGKEVEYFTDLRAKLSKVIIDNIIIWNRVIPPSDLF